MEMVYNNLTHMVQEVSGKHATAGSVGHRLYKVTDCGPWTVFLMKDQDGLYYETKKAWDTDRAWEANCIGIRIGSIVEGCDADCTPIELLFPFTDTELDTALEKLNSEATELWVESNEGNLSIEGI